MTTLFQNRLRSGFGAAFALSLILLSTACGKKPAPPPPPPPPPAKAEAPAPPPAAKPVIAEFAVEPSRIERGQSAILRWNVTGGTAVISNGIGSVNPSGTQRITPNETTTYTLTATGPGGTSTSSATVTVTVPTPAPPPVVAPKATLDQRLQSDLSDALFDYDQFNVRDDARATLSADADALKKIFADFPNATINVEGHCDERGSAEYNLGLGDRRASAARDFLVQLGVPAAKLKTISYGKERPTCTEASEGCWQKNRRAHFSTGQ